MTIAQQGNVSNIDVDHKKQINENTSKLAAADIPGQGRQLLMVCPDEKMRLIKAFCHIFKHSKQFHFFAIISTVHHPSSSICAQQQTSALVHLNVFAIICPPSFVHYLCTQMHLAHCCAM